MNRLILALCLLSSPAFAQELTAPAADDAVDVSARTLEWRREEKVYEAIGDAVVIQGGATVKADRIRALYRDKTGGGTEIHRIEAEGHVHILSEGGDAVGDKGVWDLDKGGAVLTGKALKLTTATDTVTARDSLEYRMVERKAVAKGDAVATRPGQKVEAETLTAYFSEQGKPGKDGKEKLGLKRLEAAGGVVISTETDVVQGQSADYDAETQLAHVRGGVKLTRAGNQLDGETAEVDMKSGISRVEAAKGGRVRALFQPSGDDYE